MCLPFGSHCVCNNQINKAFLQFSNCEVINQPQIDQSGGFDLPKPTWNLSRSFVLGSLYYYSRKVETEFRLSIEDKFNNRDLQKNSPSFRLLLINYC